MQEGNLRALRMREPIAPKVNASSWDVAKWLIPSVSALFIVLGYIAEFAHHAFLGFDPGLLDPNEYLATTGECFRWMLHLLESGGSAWRHALLDPAHVVSVIPAAALGIGIPLWRDCNRARERVDLHWMRRAHSPALLEPVRPFASDLAACPTMEPGDHGESPSIHDHPHD